MDDLSRRDMIIREFEGYMRSGKYPVANLSLFDILDQLNLKNSIKEEVEYTNDLYANFVKNIRGFLSKEQEQLFLEMLRNADIIDNQSLEKEDSFLIALYRQLTNNKELAINRMISNYGKELSDKEFIYNHDLLLSGTSSDNILGPRDCNSKFVGAFDDGVRRIDYFPIDYKEINTAIDRFVVYYNKHINDQTRDYDTYIKPIIYHGLIAALQLFNDGNTRYGRLFQHVELWGMQGNDDKVKTSMPILYATRQYFQYRYQYRDLIKKIVVQNDGEAWCYWINFNLRRMQDGLNVSEDNIKKIKTRI